MDNTKISGHQLFSLAATGGVGGSVILISSTVAGMAKQNAWITALLAPALGIPVIWVYWFLGSRYPCMTFVNILKKIFGKWIGLIAAAGFEFLFLTTAYRMLWYMGNFMTTQAMPETPSYVIDFLFMLAIVLAALYGIETIARASELLLYFASVLFIFAMVLALPNAKIENLQPVLETGIIPIIKSSVILSCYTTFSLITLMMIYPFHLNNVSEIKKSLFKGYLWAGFIIFITILMSILILGGGVTAKSQYPTYLLAEEINIGVIFSRLEFIIETVWVVTQFMISVLFFYAGVTGLSQLLGLKEYKRIVIPLGLVVFVMSGVAFQDADAQAQWSSIVWPPYIITFGFILPILLLIVFLIKNGYQNRYKE